MMPNMMYLSQSRSYRKVHSVVNLEVDHISLSEVDNNLVVNP